MTIATYTELLENLPLILGELRFLRLLVLGLPGCGHIGLLGDCVYQPSLVLRIFVKHNRFNKHTTKVGLACGFATRRTIQLFQPLRLGPVRFQPLAYTLIAKAVIWRGS